MFLLGTPPNYEGLTTTMKQRAYVIRTASHGISVDAPKEYHQPLYLNVSKMSVEFCTMYFRYK